jgi:hypothetical protein
MSKKTDQLIAARETERKARERLEELVNQFLRVAEGLYDWQNADFDWQDNRFVLAPRQLEDSDKNTGPHEIDVPTISDIHDAVLKAQAAAKNLGEAVAGLAQERQLAMWPTGPDPSVAFA